jgi:hypothetical protein
VASGANAVAIGYDNDALATSSVACGVLNKATQTASSAVGYFNTADGSYASAFGNFVNNSTNNCQEFGYWTGPSTRASSIRLHGSGYAVFSVPIGNTGYGNWPFDHGSEPDGTIFQGGLSFKVNTNGQLWAFYNSGGSIKSGNVCSFL